MNAVPRLQDAGDSAGTGTGQEAGRQRKQRMPGCCDSGGHRKAEGKAAFGGQVRNGKNPEADINAQSQNTVEKTELKGSDE